MSTKLVTRVKRGEPIHGESAYYVYGKQPHVYDTIGFAEKVPFESMWTWKTTTYHSDRGTLPAQSGKCKTKSECIETIIQIWKKWVRANGFDPRLKNVKKW